MFLVSGKINKLKDWLKNDIIFKNSIFLTLSSFTTTFFGFIFWIIVTRLYTPATVGIASNFLSALDLITFLALFGFDQAIIRYLPNSKNKRLLIGSCITLSLLVSLFFWGIYILFASSMGIGTIPTYIALMIPFIASINVPFLLFEPILISMRRSKQVFFMNLLTGIFKLILPFFLITLSFFGIFVSYTLPMLLSLIFALILNPIRFSFQIRFAEIKTIFKFSFMNYLTGAIPLLRMYLLNLILLKLHGSETVAFFYMAFNLKSVFLIIPFAVSKILFSEHSISKKNLFTNVKKWAVYVTLVSGALASFIILFGKFILLIFGREYMINSYILLVLFSITSIPMGIKLTMVTIFKVNDKLRYLLYSNAISLFLTISGVFLLKEMVLFGVGVSWLVGDVISLIYLAMKVKS